MRAKVLHGQLLIVLLFSCGCGSTLCMESKKHLQHFDGGARPVYVTNPEMRPEYDILKASGIYRLTSQTNGARYLTLQPIHEYGRCGNPLMLSGVTLGIVPGVLPAARTFEYDLETDGFVEPCVHFLPLYERFSIWEWLVPHHEQKVLAEGLAWSARERPPDTSPPAASVP